MSTTTTLIDAIIEHATDWRVESSNIRASVVHPITHTISKHDVLIVDFGQRHPLLPRVFQALLESESYTENEYVEGSAIRGSVALLENRVTLANDKYCGLLSIVDIVNIYDPGIDSPYLSVQGKVADFVENDGIGPYVPVIQSVGYGYMEVERSYWNELYPGWVERLKIGDALGLNRVEMMAYAFQNLVHSATHISTNPPEDFTLDA